MICVFCEDFVVLEKWTNNLEHEYKTSKERFKFTHLFIYLFIYSFIHLCMHFFNYLFIYVFIYLFIYSLFFILYTHCIMLNHLEINFSSLVLYNQSTCF